MAGRAQQRHRRLPEPQGHLPLRRPDGGGAHQWRQRRRPPALTNGGGRRGAGVGA